MKKSINIKHLSEGKKNVLYIINSSVDALYNTECWFPDPLAISTDLHRNGLAHIHSPLHVCLLWLNWITFLPVILLEYFLVCLNSLHRIVRTFRKKKKSVPKIWKPSADSTWAQLLLYSVHRGKDRKINKETQSILKVHLTHTHMYIQYPHT